MQITHRCTATALALAMIASGLLLAAPASAHELNTKPTAKSKKNTYVGLGIGDHVAECIDDHTPGQVTVSNPVDGSKVAQAFPPEPKTNACLGGSTETINPPGATQPSIPSDWSVWIQDAVGTALGNHNLYPVAAFATMEVEIVQEDVSGVSRTCQPASTHTQVCVEQSGADVTKIKQVARFAVCGAGETTGIDTTTFSERSKASDDDYRLTKTVFVDGPLFYGTDCALGATPVPGTVNEVIHEVNKVTCDELGAICIFPLPVPGASCWIAEPGGDADWSTEAKHQVAGQTVSGLGTVGTIGWNHDLNRNCQEDPNEGTWLTSQGLVDVEVDNFPVTADGEPVAG